MIIRTTEKIFRESSRERGPLVSFPGMLIKRILCGEDAILNNVDQSQAVTGRLGGGVERRRVRVWGRRVAREYALHLRCQRQHKLRLCILCRSVKPLSKTRVPLTPVTTPHNTILYPVLRSYHSLGW